MKKNNKPLRAAGILLLATMLTTCMTAGTFAKYTTSGEAEDSARVAKFGVTVSADGSLYGEEYSNAADGNTIIAYTGNANTGTVQVSTTGENVVAPGTKNETGLGFGITGTPEVDVKITSTANAESIYLKGGTYGVMTEMNNITATNFAASGDLYEYDDTTEEYTLAETYDNSVTYYKLSDTATVADTGYYPVVYKWESTNDLFSYTDGTTSADSLNAIIRNIESNYNSSYDAHADLASNLGSSVLTWEWAYDGINDGADTILGDLMAGDALADTVVKLDTTTTTANTYKAPVEGTDYNLETSFELEITVTQID